ncbi:MAG: ABC transporter ATP-binding protein [Dehalococcoidia bacterium]|nr:MAG: ABC transporter ATP-binding protein [Dehalococcoidia bacterium]
MALIETLNIGQKYGGQDVLKDVSLDIEAGEVFALIGPTGAGKTTLLRLLDLLETPAAGSIRFDGRDVTANKSLRLKARRRMAFVLQKPVVFNMSVYDNVACGLKWRKEKEPALRQRVNQALELSGMAQYAKRNARTLSGGETQRVAIARALAIAPEVLFLDEPTANLDPVSTAKIEEVLAHIIAEGKTTVVMATHNMSQGQRLAGRIGVMMNGRLLQMGSPGDIFSTPGNKEVAEFVGVDNILSGVIVNRDEELVTIDVNGALIQAISDYPIGAEVHALIRPEDVTLALHKDASSARNTFEGSIAKTFPIGALVRVEVACGFPLFAVVTKRSAEDLDLAVDKKIYATFKATAVHIIKRWN